MSRRRDQNIIFLPSLRGPSRISSSAACPACNLAAGTLLVSGSPRQTEAVLMDEVLGAHSVGTAGTLQVVQGPGFGSLILWPLTSPLPQLPAAELLDFLLMVTGFRQSRICPWCLYLKPNHKCSVSNSPLPSPYSSVHSRAL